jgi:hypothetical protein
LLLSVSIVFALWTLAPGTARGQVAAPDLGAQDGAITQKIAVWRIDALGITQELVVRLETLFRMELDRLASKPLPSRREIEAAIGKELRECSGDDKCLTAIGKKVGVDVVVTGSVAALGDSYILNIKATDVATGKLLRRHSTEPLRGSPDELIEAMRVAAYRLLAPDQLHGSVGILTDVVGATVSVDSKAVGKTPMVSSIPRLALGKHVLRVEADGYIPFEETVDVRFQKSTRVAVQMVTRAAPVAAPVVVTQHRSPWYSRWYVVATVGVVAVVTGVVIGRELAKPDIIDCNGGGC